MRSDIFLSVIADYEENLGWDDPCLGCRFHLTSPEHEAPVVGHRDAAARVDIPTATPPTFPFSNAGDNAMDISSGTQRRRFAVAAFLCGFNVMLIEVCAFRVLQTHFGSSVFIAGILLTVVFLSMTAGSYMGGTRKILRSEDAIVVSLAIAVLYMAVVHLIFRDDIIAALSIWKTGYVRFVYPAAASCILYFVPMLALSMLFPICVHSSAGVPGSLVGKLIAVSNLGSICGVLLTTFLFLPLWGLTDTTTISMLTLLVCCWALCRRARYVQLALVSAAVIGLLIGSRYIHTGLSDGIVARGQSLYGEYTVRLHKREGVLRSISYSSSRVYIHSAYRFGGLSRNRYELDALSYGFLNRKRTFLQLGSGAGGVLRVFSELKASGISIDGVELDPSAIQIAREWFHVIESPALRMVNEDARVFLQNAEPRKYDYVTVDLFSGESLPVHCLTYQFFRLLHDAMADDGVFFFNTNLPQNVQLRNSGYNALGHVVASIRKAGFHSMFINNQEDQGYLYVFKEDIPLSEVLDRIVKFADDTNNPEAIRLSLLANYFSIQAVPREWLDLAHYSDDLIPEPVIYSYFMADWRSRVSAIQPIDRGPEAPLLSALNRFAARPYSDESRIEYARAILSWAERNPEADVRRILASTMCWEVSQELLDNGEKYSGPASRRLISYLRGVDREASANDAIKSFYLAM